MDSVVAKLRKEAARLGANGVLFRGTADGYGSGGVSVGAGGGRVGGSSFSGGGIGVNISPRQKYARGIAIYVRSEEHTSELQSLMRISYAVFCLKKKKQTKSNTPQIRHDKYCRS